jgi:periplasmic divalent cation tolerance protein
MRVIIDYARKLRERLSAEDALVPGRESMTETGYLVAMTTVGDAEQAVALARALLDRRLVACVNVLPGVRSLYRWKGSFADEAEQVLLMKTRADRFEELSAAVAELHPYEVPELIAFAVEKGAPSYLRWIDSSLSADGDDRNG